MTWDELASLASDLPGVERSTSYGTPALKVRGRLLTRLRTEDDSLVLFDVPAEERDMLISADPAVFHTTPHYDGSATVLARLATLRPDAARRFLERRWRGLAAKTVVARFDAP